MTELDAHTIRENLFEDLNHRWMTIGATDGERANAMTAGWGGWGVIWEQDVFFCMVRKSRYTYDILENTDTITLSFFGDGNACRRELTYLGRTSGRAEDKLSNCGLTPVIEGKEVYFKEAEVVLSGKILAKTDLTDSDLIDPAIRKFYEKDGLHRIYICALSRARKKD